MPPQTSSAKIMHNSFWYGLEQVLEIVVFFGTSVAVARYLGKDKVGYFSYINFLVLAVHRTTGTGLAGATRKYMAEFLATDQPGLARAVYNLAYKYQLLGATVLTTAGIVGVLLWGDPAYRTMASILILSMLPGVMSWVPAQANQAFEDVYQNTLSSLGYIFSYTLVILLTLHFHWDLIGVASASLVGRTVEVIWRTVPLHARLRSIPLAPISNELARRIRRFFFQALGIQIVSTIVWDRSELIFLGHYSSYEQIAFYSISFGLAANLLMVPRTFGSATGITLMIEAARDPRRIDSIVRNSCRFVFLVVFPVHLGAAIIAHQAIALAYGPQYAPAGTVLIIAALLSIPRAFFDIPDTLLRSFDRSDLLLRWMIVTGVINIAIDWLLIPRYGAIGAAWGNGIGQTFGIVALWVQSRRLCTFGWPTAAMLRLFAAALGMAAAAWAVGRSIPGTPGMFAAIATAVPVYILLVKLFHGLDRADFTRLSELVQRVPQRIRGPFLAIIAFLIPPDPTSA